MLHNILNYYIMLGNLANNLGRALMGKNVGGDLLVNLVTYVIVLVVLLSLGKYLWNDVLVKLVSIAKPVKSIWELLGLQILLSLMFC